jgi:hypothetical protein
VQFRVAPALRSPPAEPGFGRAVTVTVLVGAGFGFLVTLTLTVFVAVAVTVTVLPGSGAALGLEAVHEITPIRKIKRLRMHAPITTACLDADQSPLAGCAGEPGICPISDRG